MLLTKDWLDRVLPPDIPAASLAAHIVGDESFLLTHYFPAGLRWMAQLTEADRFSDLPSSPLRPAWRDDDDTWYPIRFEGLTYKSKSDYATQYGYDAGTVAWAVRFESSRKHVVYAETPELAVIRGIIVMAAHHFCRDSAPHRSPDRLQEKDIIERWVAMITERTLDTATQDAWAKIRDSFATK